MPRITVNHLNIDLVHDTAGVFYGQNFQHQFRHSQKQTDGFGHVTGDHNCTEQILTLINDQDVIDTIIKRWTEAKRDT